MLDNKPDTAIVRAATIEDAALLRRVRLSALHESPDTFLSRYEDLVLLTDEQWRTLIAGWTSPPNNAVFIATDDGIGIGMCGAFLESAVRVKLVAMWVAPLARGTAVARRLLEGVFDFARGLDAKEVSAWVVDDNHRAMSFYQRNSFQRERLRQPYEPDPSKDELLFVRRL